MTADAPPRPEPDIRCTWLLFVEDTPRPCECQATEVIGLPSDDNVLGYRRAFCADHGEAFLRVHINGRRDPLVRFPVGSEGCLALECAFHELAKPWPDLDSHGASDGNNPHVWLPYSDEFKEPFRDHYQRCPCGMFEHEEPILGNDPRVLAAAEAERDAARLRNEAEAERMRALWSRPPTGRVRRT